MINLLPLVAEASSQADTAGLNEFTEDPYWPPSVSNSVLNADSSFRNFVAIKEFFDYRSENSSHGTGSSLADAPQHVIDSVCGFAAAFPSDISQGTLRKLAGSRAFSSCRLGLRGPSRQSMEVLSKYFEDSHDSFNCSISTVDANNNIEQSEPEHALFPYLSEDTLTPDLGLQGSTLLARARINAF